MTSTLEGGCTCGAVRYRMVCPPLIVHCCHCTWCQRETGSAFAINALIETDRVELLSGEPVSVDTPSASGQGQRIDRCPACQTALWSHYAYGGIGEAIRFVRVGTLDAPGELPPDVHIFVASKPVWLALPDGAVQCPEYYRTSELWPEASLQRRAQLYRQAGPKP